MLSSIARTRGPTGGREPPLGIQLAPWAVEVAQDLHDRFGEEVALQVRAVRISQGVRRSWPAYPTWARSSIRTSWRSSCRRHWRCAPATTFVPNCEFGNRADGDLDIRTNGGVTGYIVDPGGGAPVGGYAGGQRLPMVTFRVEPSGSTEVPLLVGTASFVPDLGYAIPAGSWGLRVPLVLGDGCRLSTPTLPITVTA